MRRSVSAVITSCATVGAAAVLALAACAGPQSALDARGPAAAEIADLWWLLLGVATAVYLAVLAVLIGVVVRRNHNGGERTADDGIALVDSGILAGAGCILGAIALGGWFWPSRTEAVAIEEVGTESRDGRLALAVAGPRSNGWWGTLVLVLVLAVSLATLAASYFYLAPRWTVSEPPDQTETLLAIIGVAVMVTSGAATRWGAGGDTARLLPRRQLGLTLGVLTGLVMFGLLRLLYGYHETTFARAVDAQGSFFYGLLVFQMLATLLYLVVAVVALLWAWRARSDARGLAPAANAVLIGYFLVFSWSVEVVMLYLSPRWW